MDHSPSPPLIDYDDFQMTCPVCDVDFSLLDFYRHLIQEHPATYVAMFSTYFPGVPVGDIITMLHVFSDAVHEYAQSPDPESYEELLQLCDHIGYHYEGIPRENIDIYAPKCDPLEPDDQEGRCAVCLEAFKDVHAPVRKLVQCKHSFCAECIERWFEEHKWCPICKNDVTATTTQIASISSSSSSEEDPVSSGSPSEEPPSLASDAAPSSSFSMNTT